MRRLWFTILMLVIATASQAQSQRPFLTDMAELKLEIARAETIGKIRALRVSVSPGEDLEAERNPPAGHKWVAVTLKGVASRSCQVPLRTNMFEAVFEGTDKKGEKDLLRINSSGLRIGKTWLLQDEDAAYIGTSSDYDRGPVEITVVFAIPLPVKEFFVNYPAAAQGKAVPSPQGRNR